MAKTKIEMLEDKIVEEGLTDEKLLEYEKLLRRAGNDWCRIQHCYLTAYNIPAERVNEAIKLIEFGIQRYGSDKDGLICAYERLGATYRQAGLFQKAYEVYHSIYPDIGNIQGEFPWCLLDTKIHADGFRYSPELEKYIKLCEEDNGFAKSFLQNKFVLALAKYIVADHYGDSDKKAKAYETISRMLDRDFKGPLYELLKRHKYDEKLKLTDECRAFLETISASEG